MLHISTGLTATHKGCSISVFVSVCSVTLLLPVVTVAVTADM